MRDPLGDERRGKEGARIVVIYIHTYTHTHTHTHTKERERKSVKEDGPPADNGERVVRC
jgi:hypothetical protein